MYPISEESFEDGGHLVRSCILLGSCIANLHEDLQTGRKGEVFLGQILEYPLAEFLVILVLDVFEVHQSFGDLVNRAVNCDKMSMYPTRV